MPGFPDILSLSTVSIFLFEHVVYVVYIPPELVIDAFLFFPTSVEIYRGQRKSADHDNQQTVCPLKLDRTIVQNLFD